jgi:UDP-N-acetylglucosamine acyltransferase
MSTQIHPTAIVDSGCELGADVVIGPYTIVEGNTILGDGTRVDAFAQVKNFTSLGKNNHIYSYACIGEAPQDIKYRGEETWLRLGDNNRIREYTTLNRGTPDGKGVTVIGSNCFLMAYTHVAHDCELSDDVIMANGATLAGHVRMGYRSVIGGLSAVHQFVRIGEYSFIGGKSGVAQDIPPYMLAAGDRAKLYSPNIIGMRRAGFDRQEIAAVKKAFHTIWTQGLSREEGMRKAEEELGNFKAVEKLLSFIRSSARGIAAPDRQARKNDQQ